MLPLRDENPHPPGFKPKITIGLIILNVVIFFYEIAVTGQFWEFSNQRAAFMFFEWGAVPSCITGFSSMIQPGIACPDTPYFSLISSMFMHGGLMHLGGNMLFLWIFGDNIELKFGKAKFLLIYLAWGIGAGLAHIVIDPTSSIPAVGASGAISGVLGAYLAMFPRVKITTFLMLGFFWRMMHIQARWFLPFWLVFQNLLPFFIGGFGVAGGGVAYMAHIGGFAIGFATGYLYKKTHSSEYTYGTRYGYRPDY
ncbi:putative rhomboid protease YdcA protein [Marine Group I thaumarchaeote SCGC AAA799-E16]|uniref:Putative rhomboid protease YdcA protein n=4 Tax=Marine Group I TaxID=905826 RepID=A0A087RN08_9ARCH|nr:putative rhomboid protease YdcA protein [Marine Group I thaumarchaeote SCGC AAA799-E16]KFM14862.1 putative rhomboid protease YdcA protein [Marine Group I thaumarchaeote SCGC AAA799-D11]KFM17618.1 putative rhomboid protease YdcA protein [Marine Group I thaumarchaeote SCGC RSA3]